MMSNSAASSAWTRTPVARFWISSRRVIHRSGGRPDCSITFDVAKPFPYGPFVGYLTPIIQKAQFEDCIGAGALECQESFAPIGTGAYMVTDFRTNDVIIYAANPNYRVEGQPAFAARSLQGRRRC